MQATGGESLHRLGGFGTATWAGKRNRPLHTARFALILECFAATCVFSKRSPAGEFDIQDPMMWEGFYTNGLSNLDYKR